ncbi:MAG: NADP-dependent isocitrate dehydrogenase [Deltaproteobacteria bacterium]|jgi:isocitrate dehydrogenase|nr:NADP-dependent isocitrate dehydrogenase [Deltaproteobacteria bacterium]
MPDIITVENKTLKVPKSPIIPYIEGDGVGPELWRAVRPVLDQAVKLTGREIHWKKVLAGEEAFQKHANYLPQETLAALKEHHVSIKGPLSTPVGGGIRSLNVAIRQALDLYACIRPITYIPGVPSPVRHPEKINMLLFRENTEDVYAGIEWKAGSPEAETLSVFLKNRLNTSLRPDSAIGIKPMTEFCSKRLVRMAINWALKEKRTSLTLVHKGNIMKFTEGAFRSWGYEVAADEFSKETIPESEAKADESRLIIKDRIADNMFMQTLLRPAEYSVLAMPNLNGDYLSDALAAQIGGLGMAPGANIGDNLAVFEATHGTAPKYAGKNLANPSSLLLSGALMLDYLGWEDAGDLVRKALSQTIGQGIVTQDLARHLSGVDAASTSDFGESILASLENINKG